jgi:hypothetical protein
VLLALNQPTRHFARPRYLVAVTTRRQRVLSIDFDKCNTVSTAGVSSFRWMPMMCYDLTVVSPHMHGASRRSASHNDMSVSRAVPNLTADTLVAQVVSRDSTCKLRHMPYSTLHCVGFQTLAFRWFICYPEPRPRILPPRADRRFLAQGIGTRGTILGKRMHFPGCGLCSVHTCAACRITFTVALAFAARR